MYKYIINKEKALNTTKIIYKEGIEIEIRPFPTSEYIIDSGVSTNMNKHELVLFNYCVVSWKGLYYEDDTPILCDEEGKKFVYDYDFKLKHFIREEVKKLQFTGISEEKKI